MEKRLVLVILFAIILASNVAWAGCDVTSGPGGATYTQTGGPGDCGPDKVADGAWKDISADEAKNLQGDDLKQAMQNLDKMDPAAAKGFSSTQIKDNLDSVKGKEGLLDQTAYNDAVGKQTGTEANVNTKEPVGGEPLPDDSGMHFDQLPEAQFNDVVLTEAQDVTVTPSSTCGKHAEALLVGTNLHANVDEFCVRGNKVDVRHADEIRIKCENGGSWMTTAVEDATIVVGDSVRFNTSTAQQLDVVDCGGTGLDMTFKKGGKAEFGRDGLSLGLSNVTASWANRGFIVQETAQSNGTARLVLDRLTRQVVYIEMSPFFTYELRTANAGTDFSFAAGRESHAMFIKRSPEQEVPQEFNQCKHCTIVDIPGHTIQINGQLSYLRKWTRQGQPLRGAGENDYVAIYEPLNPDASASLTLDENYFALTQVFLNANAPPSITRMSNYVWFEERRVGEETHRLMGIDEKLPAGDVADTLVLSYKTSYSTATTSVKDSNLAYGRGSLFVKVLSPDNPAAGATVAAILALHGALLPMLFIFRNKALSASQNKKGQMTIFIILGLVLLIVVAFMFFLGGQFNLPQADVAGVNGYVKGCFEQEAFKSLQFIGTQGGATTAPFTRWFDMGAHPKTIAEVEDALRQDTAKRATKCIDELKKQFKGIKSITTAEAAFGVQINKDDVTFTMKYPASIVLAETTFTIADQVVVEFNALSQTIWLGQTVTQSEGLHDGLIDLDTLEGQKTTITFLPYQTDLLTLIKDDLYAENGRPYEFAFANRR